MGEFGLDLERVEDMIDDEELEAASGDQVVLGVLDGTTPPEEWIELVGAGNIVVLAIEGNLEELAREFVPQIDEQGGNVVHFRSFLIITPPGQSVDNSRL